MSRNNLLAQVHIAKKQLGMDDDMYERFLRLHTRGKTSAKDLSITELQVLITAFKHAGFKPALNKSKGVKYKAATSRKIVSLWIQLKDAGKVRNSSDKALRQWCQTACELEELPSLDWLDEDNSAKCIEALKSWLARK